MTELATAAQPATAPTTAVSDPAGFLLEQYRAELTGYAYRMLGSAFEAEDAVQETLVRAWRGLDRFEGRAALRSWLYRIATNVCLDMLGSRERRARPMDLGPALTADSALGPGLPDGRWIEPIPDARVLPTGGDPAAVTELRETIRLAFVAALQHLPPRQRAVLILREVLQWRASEVAELLDTSVASVNSALQRARATLATRDLDATGAPPPMSDEQHALLERYVDAFERYDMGSLTALLHEDASWNMPPYELWLQTHRDIEAWCLGPGIGCRGSRLVPVMANGLPAFGQYKPSPDGGHAAWSLQVLELSGDRIGAITFFLDTARMFPLFRLPLRLEARPPRDGQDVAQPHQVEQVEQLWGRVPEHEPAAAAASGEPDPADGIHDGRIGPDQPTDVADDDHCAVHVQQVIDPVTATRGIGTTDPTGQGDDQGSWILRRSQRVDRRGRRLLAVAQQRSSFRGP